MPILQIEFKLNARQFDLNPIKPTKGMLNLDIHAPITEFAKAGHNGFKPPANTIFGHWSSHSHYIGKEISGKYYVTRINFPNPGKYADIGNPVGLFFDSTSDSEPFLTLYHFDLTRMYSEKPRGILKTPKPFDTETWVDWYRVKP